MRNFLTFVLALSLVFSGKMLLNPVPKGIAASSDQGIVRAAELTSVNSTDSNAVEKDGIRFEILMPERVLTIPANQPGVKIPVKLGIGITNKTQKPVRFTQLDTLVPKLVAQDGKALERGGGGDETLKIHETDFPFVLPGKSVTFFLEARLYWHNNKLRLGGSDGFGKSWYFDDLQPSSYKVGIEYKKDGKIPTPIYDPEIATSRVLEGFWVGQVTTPLVDFRLVELS